MWFIFHSLYKYGDIMYAVNPLLNLATTWHWFPYLQDLTVCIICSSFHVSFCCLREVVLFCCLKKIPQNSIASSPLWHLTLNRSLEIFGILFYLFLSRHLQYIKKTENFKAKTLYMEAETQTHIQKHLQSI
jgi:hypothetical protein